jgi:hypothetical protein
VWITLAKLSRDYLGFWPITVLILVMMKEFCCAKMPEFCGRKPLKRGKENFGRRRSFLGLDFSITAGGIRALEPAITPFKALLGSTVWKRIVGSDSSGIHSVATGPSEMTPNDTGEDVVMEGDASTGGAPSNNVINENVAENQQGQPANKKRPNPNGDNNNDDEDDDNRPPVEIVDEDEEFDRLAKDAEQLKTLLRLAEGNQICGSCTLLSTFQKNEVVLLFVAIKYTRLPEIQPRRGFVLYKIKETGMSDMDLSKYWAQPNRWVFMEVANKPFAIPSFLIGEFERSTRMAIQRRGVLNFQTVSSSNPVDEGNDDWTAEINGRTTTTTGIDHRMAQLTITPPQVRQPPAPTAPTSSRNLFGGGRGEDDRGEAPGSAGRSRDPTRDNFRLFSATWRSKSLDRKENSFKMPNSVLNCPPEKKWSLASPLFFERFCQDCWEEVVQFGHGPRTWLWVMQSRLASDELQTLNPLFAFSGTYSCRASNTTIQNLGCPNPVEWVRCGSVLIYDARISETRFR